MDKFYLSRAQTRLWSTEIPVGDPFAFGQKNDPVTAIAGATVASGVMGSRASRRAARAQSASAQAGIDEQARQFDLTREDFAPYREAGVRGLRTLEDYLGLSAPAAASDFYGSLRKPFTAESLAQEPGYQFGLSQGEKAIERAARARGLSDSGATLKALLRYGQDYAGTKYMDAFNRDLLSKRSIYNMLAGITGTGQTSTEQVAQAGQASAANIANLLGQQGNARAAGIVGANNAWTNALNQGLGAWQNMNMLNWLRNQDRGTVPMSPMWGI